MIITKSAWNFIGSQFDYQDRIAITLATEKILSIGSQIEPMVLPVTLRNRLLRALKGYYYYVWCSSKEN